MGTEPAHTVVSELKQRLSYITGFLTFQMAASELKILHHIFLQCWAFPTYFMVDSADHKRNPTVTLYITYMDTEMLG
jgi:hypothetical protein